MIHFSGVFVYVYLYCFPILHISIVKFQRLSVNERKCNSITKSAPHSFSDKDFLATLITPFRQIFFR